jgi:hypothetical protein
MDEATQHRDADRSGLGTQSDHQQRTAVYSYLRQDPAGQLLYKLTAVARIVRKLG